MEVAELVKQNIEKRTVSNIRFINSYSLLANYLEDCDEKDSINYNFIDGKPLCSYLKFKFKREVRQTRGIDYLRNTISQVNLKMYSQTILTFDLESGNEFRKQFMLKGWDPDLLEVAVLDETKPIQNIPYFGESANFKSGVIWICAGTPKQDKIAKSLIGKFHGITVGIGGAIDFISNKKKEAPKLIRQAHLEWFYRMLQEPRRLAKRYLIGNCAFLYLVLLDYFSKKRNRINQDLKQIYFSLPYKSKSNYLTKLFQSTFPHNTKWH